MKAIAKYLPVEGEIREGGLYFNEHGHLTVYAGISKPDDKCKKVKLFAVTQDGISNGDKVWDQLRKTYWTCSDKITCNGEIYWKILGELSLNATWVKDGEEIEGKLYPQFKGDKTFVWSGSARNIEAMANMEEVEKMIFVVKCPTCNAFH